MNAPTAPRDPTAFALRVRKQLVAQASQALPALLNVVQERLFASMDEAAPAPEKQLRRDTWMAFQKNKNLWLDGVLKTWERILTSPPATRKTDLALGVTFELVGNEVVENKIVASRLALGLMETAATEVNDLRTRLRATNSGRELYPNDIVHPETLFLALIEQWAACGMSPQAWPLINEVVRGQLFEPLKIAYAACNALLVEHGVLPVIEFGNNGSHSGFVPPAADDEVDFQVGEDYQQPNVGNRSATQQSGAGAGARGQAGRYGAPVTPGMSGQPGQPGQSGQSGQSGQPGQPGPQMAGGYGAPPAGAYWQGERAQGLMEQISRLLVGMAQSSGGAPFGISQPSTGSMPSFYPSGDPAMGGLPMQGGASGMYGFGGPGGAGQPGRQAHAGGGTGVYGVPSVPLISAIAQQPMLSDMYYSQPGAVLQGAAPVVVQRVASQMRQQSAELKSKAGTEGEKAVIELVALMFQAILEEDRIPSGIRVWFARLQMPVLRMALEEPEFFTKLDHPVRQLIDHMGSCVLGFDASGLSSAALEVEVKRIVQVIEQYPETGTRVYQRVYEEFQLFLKKHLTQTPGTQKVVAVAEQVEQKETLAIQYTIELRNLIKDMPVRDEIREFLYKVWAEVLAISAIRQGPQHEGTLALKKAASDLIWAASAKPNRADRARVIAGLPNLLQSLRTGLALTHVQPQTVEEHIKAISAVLVEAFMSKTQAIATDQIKALAERLANLEDYVTDGGAEELPLDAQSIEDLLGLDASALDVVSQGGGTATPVMLEWVRGLDLGAWFVLKYNAQEISVQYAWRSPQGYLHLFASSVGRSYLIQSVRVAGYLQAGLLEPQEREPLTLRATRTAMRKLEAEPSRLLA